MTSNIIDLINLIENDSLKTIHDKYIINVNRFLLKYNLNTVNITNDKLPFSTSIITKMSNEINETHIAMKDLTVNELNIILLYLITNIKLLQHRIIILSDDNAILVKESKVLLNLISNISTLCKDNINISDDDCWFEEYNY